MTGNFYQAIFYKDNKPCSPLFPSWKECDDYIFKHKLHAYVLVYSKEELENKIITQNEKKRE